LVSLHTRDYFGNRAIELAGIIVDPNFQQSGIGLDIVKDFTDHHRFDRLVTYTRNPSVLRILGGVAMKHDVLSYDSPGHAARDIPHASVQDGVIYHINRYAPHGLYGGFDPATRKYNGQILKQRCEMLDNKNNALAVSVDLTGEE